MSLPIALTNQHDLPLTASPLSTCSCSAHLSKILRMIMSNQARRASVVGSDSRSIKVS